MASLKDILTTNGWWLRRGAGKKPTHLLLDGGRVCVPEDSEGTFLNQYVLLLAKGGPPPAVVELRTPTFRLFMDIDARLPPDTHFDFDSLYFSLYSASKAFFQEVPRMIVCTAPLKHEEAAVKHGMHIIWPTIYVTSAIAMAFRDQLIPALREEFGDDVFVNSWEDIVDVCVYKANGLRMPWSVKGPGDTRPYIPFVEVTETDGMRSVGTIQGVTALRTWIQDLSIRAHGKAISQLQDHVAIPKSPLDKKGGSGCGTTQSLDAYKDILPLVEAALPQEYRPQQFTGLFRTPNTVMLRSTSKFCRNVGREHTSSTVFFVVSRHGVSQKCFCRKDTMDGRSYCFCRDYESEIFPLAQEAIDTFLGAAAAAGACVGAKLTMDQVALPSQKSKSSNNLDSLLTRALGKVRTAGVKKKGKKS